MASGHVLSKMHLIHNRDLINRFNFRSDSKTWLAMKKGANVFKRGSK